MWYISRSFLVEYYQFPSSTKTTTILIHDMVLFCLLEEINEAVASLENTRNFLFQKNILKSSMSCPGCNESMFLTPCSLLKSPDGLIWCCSPCKKYKNIRTDSVHSGQKLTLKNFVQLLFCFSIKGLAGIAISQLTGLSENAVSDLSHTLFQKRNCIVIYRKKICSRFPKATE